MSTIKEICICCLEETEVRELDYVCNKCIAEHEKEKAEEVIKELNRFYYEEAEYLINK